jgi:hypothetical protein
MVKPPLRTKFLGFKVREEEYAPLERSAQVQRNFRCNYRMVESFGNYDRDIHGDSLVRLTLVTTRCFGCFKL